MKILFVGGGTGGSVSPLLAIAQEIKRLEPNAEFLFVGAKNGPEKDMAGHAGMPFASIPSGKWRRYFSFQNFLAPLQVLAGLFASLALIKKYRPDAAVGAGSFVQVPLLWAAKLMGVPALIHQQDVVPGLANKLCELCASRITVTFEKSLKDFSSRVGVFDEKKPQKVFHTGNPFRRYLSGEDSAEARKFFGLHNELPVLLVLGGGTGSQFLNDLVARSLPELSGIAQVLHATGKGMNSAPPRENYRAYEFITEMGKAYAAADFVLCRAGLGTITELSNLGKIGIMIPMPDSHQELNALYLAERHAVIAIRQDAASPELLVRLIRKLLFDMDLQKELATNIAAIMPGDGGAKIAKLVLELARNTK